MAETLDSIRNRLWASAGSPLPKERPDIGEVPPARAERDCVFRSSALDLDDCPGAQVFCVTPAS